MKCDNCGIELNRKAFCSNKCKKSFYRVKAKAAPIVPKATPSVPRFRQNDPNCADIVYNERQGGHNDRQAVHSKEEQPPKRLYEDIVYDISDIDNLNDQ